MIVRNSFVSILIFSLQTPSSHEHSSSHTCPHLHYDLTTCLFRSISFRFTIHTKSKPSRTSVKSIWTFIEDRSYLLARLFARHLLPSDTISQGFADWQPWHSFLHELVMRLYISRYRVQGNSWCWWSFTMGWRGDRWRNQNQYRTLQPRGDISRCRQWLVIDVVDGLHSSLPYSPTPAKLTIRHLTHHWPFASTGGRGGLTWQANWEFFKSF